MIMSGLSSLQLTRKDIKALIATRQTVRKTGKMTFLKDTLSKITVNTFGKNDEDVSTYLGPAIVPIFVVITGALGAFGLGYAIGKDVENAMDEPQSEPQGGEVCECSDGSIEITPNKRDRHMANDTKTIIVDGAKIEVPPGMAAMLGRLGEMHEKEMAQLEKALADAWKKDLRK